MELPPEVLAAAYGLTVALFGFLAAWLRRHGKGRRRGRTTYHALTSPLRSVSRQRLIQPQKRLPSQGKRRSDNVDAPSVVRPISRRGRKAKQRTWAAGNLTDTDDYTTRR